MIRRTFLELAPISALLVLVTLLVNPFGIWMPSRVAMLCVALMVVISSIFVGLILTERARDERETLHLMIAGRIGYIAGFSVLVLAVAVQSIKHSLDTWVALALAAMVIGKLAGLIFSRHVH